MRRTVHIHLTALAVVVLLVANWSAAANAAGTAEKKITVSAPVEEVWQIVRLHTDASRKVLSCNIRKDVIVETFRALPVIGDADCVYEESQSGNSMEYKLIRSNKLKEFSGRWTLTSISKNETEVDLTSTVETGLHIPFADKVTANALGKMVGKRLSDLKENAERNNSRTIASIP
jgi:hypothetical protein